MNKSILVIFLAVFVLSLVFAGYFYIQYQKTQKYLKNPNLAGNEERIKVVAEVSKLMDLPQNDEPTLASVTDISKLKGQEFFAKAKNGDKMLIYTGKKEIILYRPSTNKIINVAPISINSAQKEASSSGTIIHAGSTPTKIVATPSTKVTLVPSMEPTLEPSSTPVPTITSTP